MTRFLGQSEDEEDKDEQDLVFFDCFRLHHPDRSEAFTCWHTATNSRSNNYGTRLDYVLANRGLSGRVSGCDIHPEVEGSDHCPVSARLEVELEPADSEPKHCSKNFPEFSGGRQQKVSRFFTAKKEEGKSEMAAEAMKRPKPSSSSGGGAPKQLKLSSFFNVKNPPVPKADKETEDTKTEMPKSSPTTVIAPKSSSSSNSSASTAWKSLLSGPPKPPACRGHGEPAALKTVTKKGPNLGRKFWSCPRGNGREGDPNANCNFFKWVKP